MSKREYLFVGGSKCGQKLLVAEDWGLMEFSSPEHPHKTERYFKHIAHLPSGASLPFYALSTMRPEAMSLQLNTYLMGAK